MCTAPGSRLSFVPGLAPTPFRTAPLPTSTHGPCPNYDCTTRSTWSNSISPLRLGMSSMSTSLLVAFPTSAVYNRTWMPTLTPNRSRTYAHGQRYHRQSREAGRLQYQRLVSSGHAGVVQVGSRPCVAQILARRRLPKPSFDGCLPASPYPINTIQQLFTESRTTLHPPPSK